jgi:hypothetical protein
MFANQQAYLLALDQYIFLIELHQEEHYIRDAK